MVIFSIKATEKELKEFEKTHGQERFKVIRKAAENGLDVQICKKPDREGLYYRTYDPNREPTEGELKNRIRFVESKPWEYLKEITKDGPSQSVRRYILDTLSEPGELLFVGIAKACNTTSSVVSYVANDLANKHDEFFVYKDRKDARRMVIRRSVDRCPRCGAAHGKGCPLETTRDGYADYGSAVM